MIQMRSKCARPMAGMPEQAVVLSPLTMLKLSYICHAVETEVGGFAISSEADPLYLEEIAILRQTATPVTTDLLDDAVVKHLEDYAEQGIPPARCGRVWVHTHPGSDPIPSAVDETTFRRAFSGCDWSLMLILARGGAFYARLQCTAGPGMQVELPVRVDWSAWPALCQANMETLPKLIPEWDRILRERVRSLPLRWPERDEDDESHHWMAEAMRGDLQERELLEVQHDHR